MDLKSNQYLNPNIDTKKEDLENEKKVLKLNQIPLSFQSRNKFVISGNKFNFFQNKTYIEKSDEQQTYRDKIK